MPRDFLTERTLAIAGVLQAAQMVEKTAHGVELQEELLRASVHSLFIFQPGEAAEVYGGPAGVAGGIESLAAIHRSGPTRAQETLRYGYDIVRVERQLSQRPDMLSVLRKRLETIRSREDFADCPLNALCSDINIIYLDTLSQLERRIRLQGSKKALNSPDAQAKIRTLLMAGVRSVMLWRQLGGNLLRLLLERKKTLGTAVILARKMKAA